MESVILKGLLAGLKVSLVCFSFFIFIFLILCLCEIDKKKNVVPLEIML